ncbi:cytochrome oxidase assembly protein-domain-containing protein [Lipomyces starkeyi]
MSRELARPALFFVHNASVKSCLRAQQSLVRSCPPPPRQLAAPFRVSGFLQKTAPWLLGRQSAASISKGPSLFSGLSESTKRLFSSSASPRVAELDIGNNGFLLRPRRVITDKSVGYWLVGSAALVFGIVVLGGLTRLTESGLSITEWKPVTGSIPPLTLGDWEAQFEKYKESPEFKLLNSNMTLDEFKFIFFMEWAHRLWGRVIGLSFVLPGLYFILRKKTSPRVSRRIFGTALLIGFQGFIGWWMVKSGLSDHFLEDNIEEGKYKDNHPRVSQYRLATHLGLAFAVYLSMLWTGLEVLKENRWIKEPKQALRNISMLSNPVLKPYKYAAAGLLGLVFLTAMSGAFVAGLDAGLIYNEFPYMGEGFIPPKSELFSSFYARRKDDSDLIWRNMLENPVTVQLIHRIMATTSFVAIVGFHFLSNRLYRKNLIPRIIYRGSHGVVGFAVLQVTLGITTLLYLVPTPIAASHQAGSLALLTSVLVLCMRLRRPRGAIQALLGTLAGQNSFVLRI